MTKNSKQLTLCPNCNLFVPLKDKCELCGFKLKSSKIPLTESILNDFFKPDEDISWDLQFIPKGCTRKLKSYYNYFFEISMSKLTYDDMFDFYYFSRNHKTSPLLTLIFSKNSKKSNFRLYNGELLIFLKINHKLDLFKKNFSIKYASKNKQFNLYYVSLGDIESSDFIKKLDLLIVYSKYISNPLLDNFEFNDEFKLKRNLKQLTQELSIIMDMYFGRYVNFRQKTT